MKSTPYPFRPIILANEERRRVFQQEHAGWQYLEPAQLKERWDAFCASYDDGIVRLFSFVPGTDTGFATYGTG